MKRSYRKTPKNYDGPALTGYKIGDLLPSVLKHIGAKYQERPDLILAVWPEIIGKKLASMTEATGFEEGVLHVKVKNSTLHSLLAQHDKPRIIQALRMKFPKIPIYNVCFRIG